MDTNQEVSEEPAIGHCNFEPGTKEWKLYQCTRSSQLKKLKDDREKRTRILEQMRKVQLKMLALKLQAEEREAELAVEEAEAIESEFENTALSLKSAAEAAAASALASKKLATTNGKRNSLNNKFQKSSKVSTNSTTKVPGTSKGKIQPKIDAKKSSIIGKPTAAAFKPVPSNVLPSPTRTRLKTAPTLGASTTKKQLADTKPKHISKFNKSGVKSYSSAYKLKISSTESKPLQASVAETKIPTSQNDDDQLLVNRPTKIKGVAAAAAPPAKVPAPRCPELPLCRAFPGTQEWEDFWKTFNDRMDKYNKEMIEFQKGMEEFSSDLEAYKTEASRIQAEENLFKQGMDLMCPPPIKSRSLSKLTIFNGYVLKAKNLSATVSDQIGHPDGIRLEINVKGIDPDLILVDREYNILTISISSNKFVRIATPAGKTAQDLEIYPPVYPQSVIIVDSR